MAKHGHATSPPQLWKFCYFTAWRQSVEWHFKKKVSNICRECETQFQLLSVVDTDSLCSWMEMTSQALFPTMYVMKRFVWILFLRQWVSLKERETN